MRSKFILAALLPVLFIACKDARFKNAASEAKAVELSPKSLSSTLTSDARQMAADTTGVAQDPGNAGQPQQGPGLQKDQAPAGGRAPQANPDWDKKIVKTADLQLEVRNYQAFSNLVQAAVKRCGGYIGKEEQSRSDYKIENTVIIKVPVEQFDEAIAQLTNPSDSNRLAEKKISSEDVTLEVVDTKSRMEAKLQVRARYLELLKQARTMSDILKVQDEINGIQEEIEAASGRIGYLSHAAAYSTINLNFFQVLNAGAKNDPEPSFFRRIRGAFGDGWDWSSGAMIGIVSLWPLWLVLFSLWLGFRKWRYSSRAGGNLRRESEGI
jgi:hypothetical protein